MKSVLLLFPFILSLLSGCWQTQAAPVPAPTPPPAATVPAAKPAAQGTLTVVLTSASSISLREDEGAELSFTGPSELFTYSVSGPAGGVTTVRLAGVEKKGQSSKVYTLTLPKGVYSTVRVECDDAGFSIQPQAADYVVAGTDSAMSATVSAAYGGKLSLDLEDSAVSVELNKGLENFSLKLDAKSCAIDVPDIWDYRLDQPFTLTRGSGGAALDLKFRDCAASVEEVDPETASRYALSSSAASMSTRGGVEMLFGDMEVTSWKGSDMSQWKDAAKPNTISDIKTVPASGVTALQVGADLCAVVLEPSKSGAFELAYQGVEDTRTIAVSAEVKNGVLSVTAQGTLKDCLYLNVSPDYRVNCVRLLVPEGVLKSLAVDCGEGIIASNGLSLPAVTGVTTRGIVNLKADAVSAPITLSTKSGDLRVAADSISGAVTMDVKNGCAKVEGRTITADVTLTATNGDVEADIGTATGKLTLTAENGCVEVKAEAVGDAEFRATNGDVEAALGTITGNSTCGVKNGTMEVELTRTPVDLTFRLAGGWRGNTWSDKKDGALSGLPKGWHDGLVLGNGKPTLTLSAAANADLSLIVP